jgi:hypothetical protein
MKHIYILFLIAIGSIASCQNANSIKNAIANSGKILPTITAPSAHILVALCDNTYQGIVPVPANIGNGQNAATNLYWSTAYGIKTFFKNSKQWTFIKSYKLDSVKLERLIFKNKTNKFYLIADAYDGRCIKQTTIDLLKSCAGILKDTLAINKEIIGLYGNAKLLAYIGHDGLMDFKIKDTFKNIDNIKRDCIVLACYSKHFFTPHLQATKANAIILTSNLMCPEAYTIHDALNAYVQNENEEAVLNAGRLAYSKYQKCSVKAASRLLVGGR